MGDNTTGDATSDCTGFKGPVIEHCFHGQQEQVVALLVLLVALGLCLYLVDRSWQRKQDHHKRATGVLNDASQFAMHLVRHFMPSMKVAKYQFRGMQPPAAPVNISFNDLGLTLHSGVKVLGGVSGEFKSGRMCAIMGPSGAGKTTFMNVLCGKATYGTMSGRVLINGHNINIKDINGVLGFVPQDDIVHETLTVREQIRFSAELRNKVNTSSRRIENITDDVLNVMQIDHIQNSIVGSVENRGISGGQRKRVNIALELAAQPAVLFLDEPTSGLDSTSSLAVVFSLKKMCQLGMNCIMVIHQPRYSLFTLFDDVLLLGKGGHAVYLGGSLGAKGYFEDLGFEMPEGENRADWFMDVISGEVPNPSIPNFEPRKLFELWEQRKGSLPSRMGTLRASNRGSTLESDATGEEDDDLESATISGTGTMNDYASGRQITADEDLKVLTRALQDEWDRIDLNRDGYLDKDELSALLTDCTNLEPSNEVVSELFARMVPRDKDVVTRCQFTQYLCSLKGDVAKDNTEDEGDLERNRSTGLRAAFLGRFMSADSDESTASEDSSSEEEEDEEVFEHAASLRAAKRQLSRKVPGFCVQGHILLTRSLIQWWRRNSSRAVFFIAMAAGALVLGFQDIAVGSPRWDAMCFVNTHTCVGLLTTIYCLNVFGENQPVFWRERNRGLDVRAYSTSKQFLNVPDILMQSFVFTALYYLMRQVRVPFLLYWIPYLLVSFAASGWGYAISAWLRAEHGPFVGALVIFVVCGLLGNPMNLAQFLDSPVLEAMTSIISITRWSIPMSFLMQVKRTNPHPDPNSKDGLAFGYYKAALTSGSWSNDFGYWWTGVLALSIYGIFLRWVAYLGLLYRNRDKQV